MSEGFIVAIIDTSFLITGLFIFQIFNSSAVMTRIKHNSPKTLATCSVIQPLHHQGPNNDCIQKSITCFCVINNEFLALYQLITNNRLCKDYSKYITQSLNSCPLSSQIPISSSPLPHPVPLQIYSFWVISHSFLKVITKSVTAIITSCTK